MYNKHKHKMKDVIKDINILHKKKLKMYPRSYRDIEIFYDLPKHYILYYVKKRYAEKIISDTIE